MTPPTSISSTAVWADAWETRAAKRAAVAKILDILDWIGVVWVGVVWFGCVGVVCLELPELTTGYVGSEGMD